MSQYQGIVDIIEREAVVLEQKVSLSKALKALGSIEDAIVVAQNNYDAAQAECATVKATIESLRAHIVQLDAEIAHEKAGLEQAKAARAEAEAGLAAVREQLHKLVNVNAAPAS